MAPMIRFFRHGDGALALFNGGTRKRCAHDRRPAGARRGARTAFRPCPPFRLSASGGGTHAGRCSIAARRRPAPSRCDAHAGCLAFELSSGAAAHRRQLRRGGGPSQRKWDDALRATAAHSTVTLADTSSASILRRRLAARPAGSAPDRRAAQRRHAAQRNRARAGRSKRAMTAMSVRSASATNAS